MQVRIISNNYLTIIRKFVKFWGITRFDLGGNSRYAAFCGRFRSPLTVYLGDRLYMHNLNSMLQYLQITNIKFHTACRAHESVFRSSSLRQAQYTPT